MRMKKRMTSSATRWTWSRAATFALAACVALALVPVACAADEERRPQPTESELAAVTATAEGLIADVIARYESEQSYRISFTQESYWSLADTTISTTGVLILKRPSQLVLRYNDGSIIASSGDTLTVYMSQTNQYFVTPIGEDDTVIDPPRVLRSFVPDPVNPMPWPSVGVDNGDGRGGRTVESTLALVPADGTGEPSKLEVKIDPSRSIVIGMVARTRSGDHTRYRITETSFGVETSPSDFVITIPPGAERLGG